MLPHDDRNPFQQNPWKRFTNASGETIPPFSVMRITGATNNYGEITFTVAKPNATQATAYLVSGPYAVAAGEDGICTTLTQAGYVAYDSGDGTPALGESWGAKNGQWTAEKNVNGFFICGGTITSAGVNAVVAIQISSGGDELVRFELTGTLALSGDAAAILLDDDGGDWTDGATAIQVYDLHTPEGMWAGISGYRGWAVRVQGEHASTRPRYGIVWMEQIAQSIQFTSTEYMGESTANRMAVTVNWYDHQGKDPGSSVIVRDPQGQFPDVHSGAKGTAVYDYHNGYYRVISSQRVAIFAEALLNGSACSSMIIDNFSIKPCGDHVGSPPTAPTNPLNPSVHQGLDNDKVQLRRINNTMPQPTWEVTDVTGHEYDVYVGMQRTTESCDELGCITADVIRARLEVCSTHIRRVVFCYPPCPDQTSAQTSFEQTSQEQTSTVVQTSSSGCGGGTVSAAILDSDGGELRIESGTFGAYTRLVDITIFHSVTPCNPPTSVGYTTINPRSNTLPNLYGSYGGVFIHSYSYDSEHPGYRQGTTEDYDLECSERYDIITGDSLSTGPDDKEWYVTGSWGTGITPDGSLRVSETQGAAVYDPSTTSWIPCTGSINILSFNPFHARMTFTPPAGYYYPSSAQSGGDADNCAPTEVEWTEL